MLCSILQNPFIPVCYVTAYLHWRILRYWIYHRITYPKVYLTIYLHPYYHWESWTWVTVNCQLYQTGVYYIINIEQALCQSLAILKNFIGFLIIHRMCVLSNTGQSWTWLMGKFWPMYSCWNCFIPDRCYFLILVP